MNGRALVTLLATVTAALAATTVSAQAGDPFLAELVAIRNQWAVDMYQTPEDQQEEAFSKLMARSAAFADRYPTRPEALIWDGIVQSSYAGVNAGFGAMAPAGRARRAFETALAIDDKAMDASAYTSLGTLYHKVPGWPIGFGSDKKARIYLEKAVQIAPQAIDPNYFYGEFLYDQGEYAEALRYLEVARQAAPRPGREIADAGRHAEIDALLEKVRQKLR